MHRQLEAIVTIGISNGAIACSQSEYAQPAFDIRSAKWNAVAIEAGRLVDDVRAALESDFRFATQAAARLAAFLANEYPEDTGLARGGLLPWQKRKVQRHIEDGLEDSLRVEALAKLAGLSSSHFCRKFKVSFGETAHGYIIKRRIERARRLMLTTSESLSQIAVACGLTDQAHLCRCFRQVTGMTPGAWRRCRAAEPEAVTG